MPTLQEFIDDELLRAPMVIDQVIDAVLQQWRTQTPAAAMRSTADPGSILQTHRSDLLHAALRQLRLLSKAPIAALEPSASPPAPLELSLVDEDEVAVDIEVSRCIEAVRALAEQELRDMQAYASALSGDPNVSRDLNPFKPEVWVRALWLAVQTLPMTRSVQAAFLHAAGPLLAHVLERSYAAACSRLHDAGVTPAVHRTIRLHGGIRIADVSMPDPGALHDLRDSMPMPLDAAAQHTLKAPSAPASTPSTASGIAKVDPQLIELLSRLFDALQADRLIGKHALPLLLRLHPTALRCAIRDPAMLETYDHPVWRFMDRVAFLLETCPRAEIGRAVPFVGGLVDDVVSHADGSASRFIWSLERIAAFERHLLERNVADAATQIDHFQRRDIAEAAPTTGSAPPLDIATLDTVPSGLLEAEHELTPGALQGLKVGMLLKAYLQGDWRMLQLLWRAQHDDVWLLLDVHAGRHHALRWRAVLRLESEALATPLTPRSLVRVAAARVLRSIGSPQ